MIRLPLHGANARVHEEKPIVDLVAFAASLGIGNVVVAIVPFNKVLHYGAGFEETDRFSIGPGVRQGGNAAIRIYQQEMGRLLVVGLQVKAVHLVGKAANFKSQRRRPNDCSSMDIGDAHPSSSSVIDILMPLGVWAV